MRLIGPILHERSGISFTQNRSPTWPGSADARTLHRMPRIQVQRTYLELRTPGTPAAKARLTGGADIARERPCSPSTYRALYAAVGSAYHWRDRLTWTEQTLERHLARDEVGIWILRDATEKGGFFELERHPDGSVEIAYFGLIPSFHGRGMGRALLERAIHEGWRWGANRLWLHTCTLDSPVALPNYRARGFVPFRTETYETDVPDSLQPA
jgi:GNAT superfamily N-acetyltransferase